MVRSRFDSGLSPRGFFLLGVVLVRMSFDKDKVKKRVKKRLSKGRSIGEYQQEFSRHADGMRRAADITEPEEDKRVLRKLARKLEKIGSAITRDNVDAALRMMEEVEDTMYTYEYSDYIIDYKEEIRSLMNEYREAVGVR